MRSIRIIELAETVAGEYCGKLLSDFGAEVIKVERPGAGSPTRQMGPFGKSGADPENSVLFAYLNTNKNSVTIDLTADTGRQMLAHLLREADVVVDDHEPGWLDSFGLDPETVCREQSELIVCSITPFGHSDGSGQRRAEDITIFHASGWGYHTPTGADDQRPPLKGAGRFLVGYEAGLEGAMCVAAALYGKEEGRGGQFIDISQQDVMAARVDYVLGQMVAGDMDVSPSRAMFDLSGPAGIFACRDGFAYIWMSAPTHWEAFRQMLGHPAWMNDFSPNWLEREATPERVALCREHIAEWLKTQDRNEVAAEAQKRGLTLVPVNDASDLPLSPQYQHRKYFQELEHPVLGRTLYPTVPYKLSETPARLERPAPMLGQHNEAGFGLAAAGQEGGR